MNKEQILKEKYFFVCCSTTKTSVYVVNFLWLYLNSWNVTRYLLLKREKKWKKKQSHESNILSVLGGKLGEEFSIIK